MEDLKKIQTIVFTKEVSIDNRSTFVTIKLEHGTNKRGEPYKSVDQVDTSNRTIADSAKIFEKGLLSINEMTQVIESQGYSKVSGLGANEYLNWLIKNKNYVSINKIEEEIGCPFTTVAQFVAGNRPLSKKWEDPLTGWIKNFLTIK